jgi:hypothetical protein
MVVVAECLGLTSQEHAVLGADHLEDCVHAEEPDAEG